MITARRMRWWVYVGGLEGVLIHASGVGYDDLQKKEVRYVFNEHEEPSDNIWSVELVKRMKSTQTTLFKNGLIILATQCVAVAKIDFLIY